MTETTRRTKIEAMLTDDPQDITLRYMLAMELDKDGENDRSLLMPNSARDVEAMDWGADGGFRPQPVEHAEKNDER